MRHRRRAELDGQVAQAYNARKGRSGASRLCHDLREVGLPCNRKTVAASMQRQGLLCQGRQEVQGHDQFPALVAAPITCDAT